MTSSDHEVFPGADVSEDESAVYELWATLTNSAGAVFAASVYLISGSSIVVLLFVQQNLTTSNLIWRLGGLLISSTSIGQLLVHIPRKVKRAPELSDPVFSTIADRMKVPVPTVVCYGPSDATQVEMRGRGRWGHEIRMLVSPLSWALWSRDSDKKVGQVAHELAHLKAGDTRRYSRLGAMLILSLLYLGVSQSISAILEWRINLASAVFFALLVVIGGLAWRTYTRLREFGADLLAAATIGFKQYSLVVSGGSVDSRPRRFALPIISSHPTPSARLKMLQNPARIRTYFTMGMFILGYAGYVGALSVQVYLNSVLGPHFNNRYLAFGLVAVAIAVVFIRISLFTSELPRVDSNARWLRVLLLSSALFWFLISGSVPGWSEFAVIVLFVVFSSLVVRIVGALGLTPALAWFGFMSCLSTGAFVSLGNRLAQFLS